MKKIPRYHAFSFLILPFVIYFFLNFSFVSTIFLKEIVTYGSVILPDIEFFTTVNEVIDSKFIDFNITDIKLSPEDRIKRIYTRDFIGTIFALSLLVFFFNLPFKMFFGKKRKNKPIPFLIDSYTKRYINFSPEIITGIVALGTLYIHFSFYRLYTAAPDGILIKDAIQNILIISIFTSILVLLLIYFGQKFRVQTRYIDHVFTIERLRKKPLGFNFPGLRARFFITTIFLTFIPLIIVLFYVFTGVRTISNISALSTTQFNFLFGDAIDLIKAFSDVDAKSFIINEMDINSSSYIDSFGIMQMIFGIIPGLFFALIYILKMVVWSNSSILKPIKELLKSMKDVSKGDLDSYTIVRSREETGQLSYGFNQMLDGLKDRERIKSLFGQYLSAEISEEILKGNIDLNGSMYQATILFADIRGFTTLSESITPHETIDFLNDYYNVLIDVIHQYGGIIDKFMGDGILVLFGVPIKSKDHADRAVSAAFEIQNRLLEFNKDRIEKGSFNVKIGIGIHTGEVIAGNVGNSNKLEYTVIGDTVNIASRIESLTKKFDTELIIGESVYDNLSSKNKYKDSFEKLNGVVLRGKRIKVNLLKQVKS